MAEEDDPTWLFSAPAHVLARYASFLPLPDVAFCFISTPGVAGTGGCLDSYRGYPPFLSLMADETKVLK